jgi:hypothetical protein
MGLQAVAACLSPPCVRSPTIAKTIANPSRPFRMPSSSESQRFQRPLWQASRTLPVVAASLLVLFASTVVGSFFPLQPMEPLWQARLAISLISTGPLALLALALLHVAASLEPEVDWLQKRLRLWSQLAMAVCLGFVLLVPVMTQATIASQSNAFRRQEEQVKAKETKVASLRLALLNSRNVVELNQQFQQLQGPQLGPDDLRLPLPEIKRGLEKIFQESDRLIARERQQLPPKLSWNALPDLLSKSVAALGLALGFSALAKRPGCQISLLQEWQDHWNRRHMRKSSRRSLSSQEQYIRRVTGED